MRAERPSGRLRTRVQVVQGDAVMWRSDLLATEEPMEIRLQAGPQRKTVAVTMRTPGHDFELAAGFLFSEGVVAHRDQIRRIVYCQDSDLRPEQRYNVVTVHLRASSLPPLDTLERHFYTTSACGLCGKASLEALRRRGCQPADPGPVVDASLLTALPERLRQAQPLFSQTGGLHAAALWDAGGELVALREDVGRHNAMDKLVGWAFLEGRLPLRNCLLMVSGRASFELVQKAVLAGAPVFCAVSAPSSLAVELAREFGLTLVGFLRGDRFNVYTGPERVRVRATSEAPEVASSVPSPEKTGGGLWESNPPCPSGQHRF